MIDLHQHSDHSDGSESVEQIIKLNKKKGIKYFSLTDHDTITGSKEILSHFLDDKGKSNYFTGIEFSTQDNGKSVHILVYDYDINNTKINKLIEKANKLRKNRVKKYIELLKSEFGISLHKEDENMLSKCKNPNKPQIAQILMDYGYGDSINEVIKKYLNFNLPSIKLSSEEVLRTLKNEDMICVLAHPLGGIGEKKVDMSVLYERIERFVEYGLKGIEVFYSLYNSQDREGLIDIAKKYKLVVSGGSDFHGTVKNVNIGELSIDNYQVEKQDITLLNKIKRFYKV